MIGRNRVCAKLYTNLGIQMGELPLIRQKISMTVYDVYRQARVQLKRETLFTISAQPWLYHVYRRVLQLLIALISQGPSQKFNLVNVNRAGEDDSITL